MDDIRIPMSSGTMDDISREDEPSSQPDGSQSETPTDSMSSQGAKAIYAREAQITIDYKDLDDELKEVRVITVI